MVDKENALSSRPLFIPMKTISSLVVLIGSVTSTFAAGSFGELSSEKAAAYPVNSIGFQLLGSVGMAVVTAFVVLLMAAIWRSRHAFNAAAARG
jgi:hypothetical protein